MTGPATAEDWAKQAAALRADQRMIESEQAISKAHALAPADPLFAFLYAQARYELGHPAAALFADARRLWPANPDVIRNQALALASEGQFLKAEALLADMLRANPQWLDGHRVLCGLRWTHGDDQGFDRSYRQACAQASQAKGLWLGWFSAIAQHRDWARASAILDDAERALGGGTALLPARAFVACEAGESETARTFLQALEGREDDFLNLCRIRFHIRQREFAAAEQVALRMKEGPSAGQAWPYLSAIWRTQGDARAAWLDGDPVYAKTLDVGLSKNELRELAETLRTLHLANRPFAEQSVRGGTQTDRSVLLRHEPILQTARRQLLEAVESYVHQLPPYDPAHPLLGQPRERLIISGSWSVRLHGGGHNVAHTHPMGWLSSAFYVSLPDDAEVGAPPAGYLSLGAPPPELGLELEAYVHVKPEPGHLVLFPSTLWHSTMPFLGGERLNIAFDISAGTKAGTG